jgi:hypothetical protein
MKSISCTLVSTDFLITEIIITTSSMAFNEIIHRDTTNTDSVKSAVRSK